jgi:two-component system sensor histidine kinase QseC
MAGCDRASHLVEQMLTLARLEPDAAAVRLVPVDLAPVLKATISDLAPGALARQIEIELGQEQPVTLLADAGLLGVLFRNVIDNAVRYSPARTRVTVDVMPSASEVRVVVTDAGPGIPLDEREHIGRRFYRPPGTQASGSGLGLSIVRRIVELHHGAMQFDTPPSGRGLQVTVALPAAAKARA